MKLIKTDDTVRTLRDIQVDDSLSSRFKTGWSEFDKIFGDPDPGMAKGSSILMTGTPGVGKSTLCMQLADALVRNSKLSVLYNMGEEDVTMAKMRGSRLGCSMDFLVSQISDVEVLAKVVEKHKPDIVIQDSIQTIQTGNVYRAEYAARSLHALAKSLQTTIIMIGHVTKGGQFAGRNSIKHDIDTHVHMTMNDSAERTISVDKNRWGPTVEAKPFEMTRLGITFKNSEPDPKIVTKSSKREEVMAIARKVFLEGKTISGYCYTKFGADCSGSFWRSMVNAVMDEMTKEGYRFSEDVFGGRRHVYISTWLVNKKGVA